MAKKNLVVDAELKGREKDSNESGKEEEKRERAWNEARGGDWKILSVYSTARTAFRLHGSPRSDIERYFDSSMHNKFDLPSIFYFVAHVSIKDVRRRRNRITV